MQKIKVIKRDGEIEELDLKKALRVAKAAGLEDNLAKQFTFELEQWIKGVDTEKVSSLKIRDKVIEILQTLSPHTAHIYKMYQKTKR